MPQDISLSRSFPSRHGVPVITHVSPEIFTSTYFTHCLDCNFCHDQCCSHGVDVDFVTQERIMAHAPELERLTEIPREQWFMKKVSRDNDFPGGGAARTRVRNGRCVFINPAGRGCTIHAYCLAQGIDYHDLKSIVDCLFPLTWEGTTLGPSEEAVDGTLACLNTGPSLYRGSRNEVEWYFGADCVEELDRIETRVSSEL